MPGLWREHYFCMVNFARGIYLFVEVNELAYCAA